MHYAGEKAWSSRLFATQAKSRATRLQTINRQQKAGLCRPGFCVKKALLFNRDFATIDRYRFATGQRFAVTIGHGHKATCRAEFYRFTG